MNHLVRTIFSYNGNLMLAVGALISLLLVILFVLLLHIYAKYWLLLSSQSPHHRRRRPSSRDAELDQLPASQSTTHITHAFDTPAAPSKGLDSYTISSIPLFVYRCRRGGEDSGGYDHDNECVICLSAFEEGDVGRSLPECGHGFHVDCIDMWLRCHTSCPICRASAVVTTECRKDEKLKEVTTVGADDAAVSVAEDVSTTPPLTTTAIQAEEYSGVEIVIHAPYDGSGADSLATSHSRSPPPSSSSSSSSTSSSSQQSTGNYGCSSSLKRMLSRNRSEMSKIHPSSTSSSVNVDQSDSRA